MPKYIDREIVVNDIDNIIEIFKNPPVSTVDKKLLEAFELWKQRFLELPTADLVKVVRCKDCKHCDPDNKHCDHAMGTTLPLSRKETDFCSYGELKERERK